MRVVKGTFLHPVLILLLTTCAADVDDHAPDPEECERWDFSFFHDDDGDGFGDPGHPFDVCELTDSDIGTTDLSDCDDSDAEINPTAAERCDGVDNNCDDAVDDDSAVDAPTWCADTDADGYGAEDECSSACSAPPGTVLGAGDCNDEDPSVHPGATDACGDGIDADCDGTQTPC